MPTDHRAELAKIKTLRLSSSPTCATSWTGRSARDDFEELTFDVHARGARHRPEERRQDPGDQAPAPALAEPALGHLLRQVRAEEAPRRRPAPHPEPGGAQEARLRQQRRARRPGPRTTCSSSPTTARATSARSASPTSREAQDGTTCRPSRCSAGTTCDTALHLDAVADELTEHLAWPDDDADAEAWRKQLARRLHPAPPRGHHHLEGALDPAGRAGPRHPRPHQDRARHRDRDGPAHQAHEGVPGGAGPRPRRRRLRRHVRADHRLRPALGAHRRPAQEDGRRLRRPHAHQPLPAGADGDLPQGRRAARQGGRAGHRLRRAGRLRGRRAARRRQHGGRRPRLRRPEPAGRPGHPLLRALPQGVRRQEADAARRLLHPAPGGLLHRALGGRAAAHRVRPRGRPRRHDHLGRDGQAPQGPRRSPTASRPTRPSSRSSTRPPAPAPSSSRSSTSSTRRSSPSGRRRATARRRSTRCGTSTCRSTCCRACTATSC